MVVIASVAFVILMIPRGISTTISSTRLNGVYESEEEALFDIVAHYLQYLNHATNFFIYILANARFRLESVVQR